MSTKAKRVKARKRWALDLKDGGIVAYKKRDTTIKGYGGWSLVSSPYEAAIIPIDRASYEQMVEQIGEALLKTLSRPGGTVRGDIRIALRAIGITQPKDLP